MFGEKDVTYESAIALCPTLPAALSACVPVSILTLWRVSVLCTHASLLAVLHLASLASSFTLKPKSLGSYLSMLLAALADVPT